MGELWRVLRSPKLALPVLSGLTLYCLASAWFPWSAATGRPAPAWAAALGLDHPFSTRLFLAGVLVLFLSTLACASSRTLSVFALWSGRARSSGLALPSRSGVDFREFLRSEGFGAGPPFFRFRHALWGGWVLHVGLLALMAGVFVQRGFHDGGSFELAEGERLGLRAPGAVFGRDKGPFAADAPPDLSVALLAFDPFLHQRGYAPDRGSRLRIEAPGAPPREAFLDRAQGLDAGPVTFYQAIPTGLCLTVEIAGVGARTFHLRSDSGRTASGRFIAPGGEQVRFVVDAERPIDDRMGTGALAVRMERQGAPEPVRIAPGTVFRFGSVAARFVSVGRWGGFSFSGSPGMPAVYAGFLLVLLGAALMTLPAGVAEPAADDEAAGWVYVTRGRDVLVAEWARRGPGQADGEAEKGRSG